MPNHHRPGTRNHFEGWHSHDENIPGPETMHKLNWQWPAPPLFSGPVETILAHALGQDSAQPGVAEKRDLLERLMGRLAHEIRKPLSSLDIHVQLIEEDLGALAPAMRQQLTPRLEIIHGELHRLKTIVENFLRLTRP